MILSGLPELSQALAELDLALAILEPIVIITAILLSIIALVCLVWLCLREGKATAPHHHLPHAIRASASIARL